MHNVPNCRKNIPTRMKYSSSNNMKFIYVDLLVDKNRCLLL